MSPAREYELVLMLDPEIPEERRAEIASEARQRIESGGTLRHDTPWGMRKLAYEIRQRTEADYRLFRFETAGELLDDLNHNLRIADGVLRFRIFKVDPQSPATVPPPLVASAAPPSRGPRRGQGPPGRGTPTRAAEEKEAAPAEETEAAAEEAAQAPEAPAEAAQAPEAPAEEAPAPAEPQAGEAAAESPEAEQSTESEPAE